MPIFSELREAAQKGAKTNFEICAELDQRLRQGKMPTATRVEIAGAGMGVGGLLGVMGSGVAVQSAVLGGGSGLLATVGQAVMAAGTVAGGVYVVPAVALGTAAIGAVGLIASKVVRARQHGHEQDVRNNARWEPEAKQVTAGDWVRAVNTVVSDRIRAAFAPPAEKTAARFFDAIRAGDEQAVRAMLRKTPDLLHSYSDRGGSALTVAIGRKQTRVVEVLFAAGATLADRAHRVHTTWDVLRVATHFGGDSYRDLIKAMAAHHGHAKTVAPSSSSDQAADGLKAPSLRGLLFNRVPRDMDAAVSAVREEAAGATQPRSVRRQRM